jgi:cytoskeletal protein CcmA (bactofilin family)
MNTMADKDKIAASQPSGPGGHIGHGAKASGRMEFGGNATVEGEVEGEIFVNGDLVIEEQAVIKGKITATSVLIRGQVAADIQAERKIEIQPPGVLSGDITTRDLVIGNGAIFDGYCSMKKENKEEAPPSPPDPDPKEEIL